MSAATHSRIAPLRAVDAHERKRGLPPVLGRDTRVLILGSFPDDNYVGQNAYWNK